MDSTQNPLTPSDVDLPPPSSPPPSSLPPATDKVWVRAMELPPVMDFPPVTEDPAAWDWGSLFDFSLDDDDPLVLPSWDPPPPEAAAVAEPSPLQSRPLPEATPGPAEAVAKRVRKRDLRLVCPNYLAGRIPCACPEVDQKAAEEDEAAAEAAAGGRKRARTGGATAVAMRCQVPGCEADIRELKGYHRRHRVCLRCANAPSAVLDGEHKRYCQQCGKFHILSDFDEGKRSCRRKLERHNKRRRRRPTGSKNVVEKEMEAQGEMLADATCDEETRKEMLDEFACDTVEIVGSNKMDKETPLGSEDGQGSPVCSLPSFQDDQNNSVVSFAASVEARIDGKLDNSKHTISSMFCDNKTAYSSTCPTGRISFKLYDWNPAEFPRRLRHQIFQWLASMPVELEGYIRPGCTILTVFIAMPQFMWEKLYQDAAWYVKDLINAPESLLRGKGIIFIYLNNIIVQVLKDGTSLMNVKMEVQPPRLHYVHPTYFEAGQPMEFIACGSNLDQPKFRLLISFAGEYLNFESCSIISRGKSRSYDNGGCSPLHFEHEIYKINITQTNPEVFGPAFVEVDNICGISNFVPVLFGNKHICAELQRMENAFSECFSARSLSSQNVVAGAISSSCELFTSKQTAMTELLLDIGWLLKKPSLDEKEFFSPINTQRLICLLKFLIHNKSASVLEVILHHLDSMIGVLGFDKSKNWTHDVDLRLLQEYVHQAREIVYQRTAHNVRSEPYSRNSNHGALIPQSFVNSDMVHSMSCSNLVKETRNQVGSGSSMTLASQGDDENVPLLTKESNQRCHSSNLHVKWRTHSFGDVFPSNVMRTRVAIFAMASIVICFTACVVLVHPHEASKFAVSIRRCLFGAPVPWKRI